jgi:hypothetical protein
VKFGGVEGLTEQQLAELMERRQREAADAV